MFGEDHPCAHPGYTRVYTYRALMPMKEGIDCVGEEQAVNGTFYVRLPSPVSCAYGTCH